MSMYTDEQIRSLKAAVQYKIQQTVDERIDIVIALTELLATRIVLREVCEAAVQRDDAHWQYCVICNEMCRPDVSPFLHAPDCPVGIAKKFLG